MRATRQCARLTMTLIEESPDYPDKVRAYLAKHNARRLPWGTLISGGMLTVVASHNERRAHEEIAETALALARGLGVTDEQLRTMVEALPWNATPEQHMAELVKMRAKATRREDENAEIESISALNDQTYEPPVA